MANRDQIGAAQFDLLVGLGKFEGQLKKGEQTAEQAGKRIGDELTESAEDAVEKGGEGLGKAVAGLAAGAAAAFGVGLKAAMDREAQSGLLGARLGLDPAESARAGRVAGEVYADNFGDGVEDAAAAIQAIQANLGGLDKYGDAALKEISEKALTLATIMDEDVNRVVRGAGQLIRNGLAPDATTAFDMILTAAQRLPVEMQGELIESIEEYSASWAQAGLSGPQALGMITAAVQAGARNTDIASDAIKEFTVQVTDGGEDAIEVLEKLGLNADAVAAAVSAGGSQSVGILQDVITKLRNLPPSEQEMAGVALFGTMFEDLGIDAIAAMNPATAAMTDFTGATQEAGDMLANNAAANLEAFKRNIETKWVNFIGGQVIPLINQLPPAFQNVAYGVMALGGGVGGLVSEFGPLLLLLGKGGAGGAGGTGLLGSLSAIGPYALIAIAALAAAYVIVENWDTISKWFRDFFGWLQDKAGGVIDWFKRNWTTLLAILTGPIGLATLAIVRNWDTIRKGAETAFAGVRSAGEAVLGWLAGMGGKIAAAAKGMWDGIVDAFKWAINSLIRMWNSLEFTLPSVTVPGFLGGGKVGGQTVGVPKIPELAHGGNLRSGGRVVVGERRQPEVLDLPRGARVTPLDHPSLSSATRPLALDQTVVVTLDGREIARATRSQFIDTARRTGRSPFAA